MSQVQDLNTPQFWENILYGMEVVNSIDADTEQVRLLATEPWSGNSLFLRVRFGNTPSE